MVESKSTALPLGDAPKRPSDGGADRYLPRTSSRHAPVYRGSQAISTGSGLKIRFESGAQPAPSKACAGRGRCNLAPPVAVFRMPGRGRVEGRIVSWEDGPYLLVSFWF